MGHFSSQASPFLEGQSPSNRFICIFVFLPGRVEGGGEAYPWCLLETTSICHCGNQLFSDDDTVLSVKKTLLFFLFYLHDSDLVK